ncbi:tripartite motif-containing protein 16-like [Cyprinus carpio]|uniref:Tripartite motif-containing protein 16-like n=1 Tax=Cyprinus carpio TaxID=7962 RepID=A0A9R0ABH7_CYPCA|nr:tripartite motif-containing protein 16-like [Cyprinus carpio]
MGDVVLTADLPESSLSSEKLQKNPEENNLKSTDEKTNGSPETENQTAGEKDGKTIEESKIQEDLKQSEDPQKPQDEEEVLGPNDVTCDSCIDRPCRAKKSCLTCLVSYCEAHLRPHLENVKFQSHRLVEPLRDIERRTCETHRCALELFCCADACCVCQECVAEEHRGHNAVPIAEARRKIERELQDKQTDMVKTVTAAEKRH